MTVALLTNAEGDNGGDDDIGLDTVDHAVSLADRPNASVAGKNADERLALLVGVVGQPVNPSLDPVPYTSIGNASEQP